MARSVGGQSGGEDEATLLIIPIVHIVPFAANGKFVPNEGIMLAGPLNLRPNRRHKCALGADGN
jgi:hypothetical protein